MQKPFSDALLTDLKRRINNDFDVGMTVAIMLCGRCPEQVGDNLRQWLLSRGYRGWRQIKRQMTDAVRFEFENPTDATFFMLSV